MSGVIHHTSLVSDMARVFGGHPIHNVLLYDTFAISGCSIFGRAFIVLLLCSLCSATSALVASSLHLPGGGKFEVELNKENVVFDKA